MTRRQAGFWLRRSLLAASLAAAATTGMVACNGCHATPWASSGQAEPPTIRLYVLSDVAGALEPCGCTKDQLGGLDHLAAFMAKERKIAPASALVAVGPTFFLDPKLEGVRATQDRWKAEAIGTALGQMGLAALAPGQNDWADGADALAKLASAARAPLVAANLDGKTAGAVKTALREIAGYKVGFAGVSTPVSAGAGPDGVEVHAARDGMARAVAELRAQGAQILVGLAAVPRGEALRLADAVPELHVLVVGKPVEAGDVNDVPTPPAMIGATLVVQTSNHVQAVGVVDLFVRGGDLKFQDATGAASADAIVSVSKRIHELDVRIARWRLEGTASEKEIDAREADRERLIAERTRLVNPPPPASGSFFRFRFEEVKSSFGHDDAVQAKIGEYYRRVNDHNKAALAGRLPPPVGEGQPGYIGIEACTACHEPARKVWNLTPHAHAYETLAKEWKEYNLDCVGCHVTGYEKPGGSTVTSNEKLRAVQCEQCHGPGEAHAKEPMNQALIVGKPKPDLCTTACHHPPHVEGFDAAARMERIKGPGHGMPADAKWPAWADGRKQ